MYGGLESTDFLQFHIWEAVVILTELIFTISMWGGCGGLKRTNFSQFLCMEGVVGNEKN